MAMEIDNMLNEFYEYDTRVLIRKHAYMDPSSHPDDLGSSRRAEGNSRPRTV